MRSRPRKRLFQAATGNLNPWTEAKVETNQDRGQQLIISGKWENIVPWATANTSYKQEEGNDGVTEIVEIMHHGQALTIDSGWREVTDTAFAVIKRFSPMAAVVVASGIGVYRPVSVGLSS